MSDLLVALGCRVDRPRRSRTRHHRARPRQNSRPRRPAHLFEAMRASIVVLGPLLARCGDAAMALPGGDDFGHRPINFHTDGLTAMGAHFHNDRTSIRATCERTTARDAHHARVPEPHRDRQPPDGVRPRRGSIGHRERRARTRGRGPRAPAPRHGRAGSKAWERRVSSSMASRSCRRRRTKW